MLQGKVWGGGSSICSKSTVNLSTAGLGPGDGATDRKICFYFVISGHKKKEDLLKTNAKSSKRIEIETAASWHKIEKLENQSSKVEF